MSDDVRSLRWFAAAVAYVWADLIFNLIAAIS